MTYCKFYVNDRNTHRKRKCKNNPIVDGYCKIHKSKIQKQEQYYYEEGICQKCKMCCNPHSQLCGRCARSLWLYDD